MLMLISKNKSKNKSCELRDKYPYQSPFQAMSRFHWLKRIQRLTRVFKDAGPQRGTVH